jgi:hypothetical protein
MENPDKAKSKPENKESSPPIKKMMTFSLKQIGYFLPDSPENDSTTQPTLTKET